MDYSPRQLEAEEFPPLLSEIPDPPKKIFVRGEMPDWEAHKVLCVVGSRKYTPYGKQACETLIAGLRGFPVIIVSGLAIGIDSIAHHAALEAGLTTVAVPGSGLSDEVLYPSMNRPLAKEILREGGLLLSEFEHDMRASPWCFEQRNRILAGLSHATLMIEAAEQSGTLITARFAGEYNRDLLIVPGSIFSDNSYGPHRFLKLGATPIGNAGDLLEALGFEKEERKKAQNLLPEEERVIAALLEPLPRDELLQKLLLSTQEANILLATMELKGLLVEEYGKIRRA